VAKAQILKRALLGAIFILFLYKKYSFSRFLTYAAALSSVIFSHPYYSSTQITPSPPSPLDFNLTSQVTKNAILESSSNLLQ